MTVGILRKDINLDITQIIIKAQIKQKIKLRNYMPPKYFSKGKRNYSNNQAGDKNKNQNRVSVTFLLIGNNRVGVDVPYKVFNSDDTLRSLIKDNQGVWDRDNRMWVLSHKNYQNILDIVLEHCKKKQYYCSKIPSFVYDAQLDMPLDLVIKTTKNIQTPLVRYIDVEVHIDPETLPFYDKLYDFQKQSLKFAIQHHGRMLLADEMGVGKTIQSLAIAFIYRYEWPLVVICPSTLRFNWLNEIMHWYGDYIKKSEVYVYTKGGLTLKDTTKILVISYDLAWKFKQIWNDFKVVIVDQAHYLKNSGCKRTDILVPELSRKKRVILLTGTPAFARPRQIFNLSSIIRPDVFHNFIQFGNRYCDPSRNPWSGAIQYNGCVNSKQLFYLLKDKIMLRRLKKDVLTQLPDKQRQKIIIQTNKAITKQITMLMQQNGSDMKKPEDMIMQMFGLKNAGGDRTEDYHKKRQSLMQAYRLSGAAKVDGVIEYILSLLENDVKLLIFAHHRAILDRIESELNSKKYKSIRIDGEVEMVERQERVGIFQNNKDIMAALLSISAAGVGLTLTASSTVVFAELHWTPGMLIQAEDRAHRIGQKNCVNCHYLIGEGTLDSMLYNYLLKKINNVSTFVDGSQNILEMQELSKGQVGKVSKTAQQVRQKERLSSPIERKSIGINPIRRPININIEVGNQNGQSSQVTDISSELTSNPFRTKQDDQQTISIKSRKKLPDLICSEASNEQENAMSYLRNKSKVKILTSMASEKIKQCQSSDSLRTSDILQLVQQGDKYISRSSFSGNEDRIKKQETKNCLQNQTLSSKFLSQKFSRNNKQNDNDNQSETDIDASP